jgi:outer membrane lipoprotein-sorting protein
VKSPAILERHPGLRWLVPAGIACIAGLAATGFLKANASSESLPQTTPTALIAAVQDNHVDGFSGTIVSHLSLGLPEVPAIVPGQDDEASSFGELLSGSHTLQVWYGGFHKQRIAMLGPTDETDLFRNGRDVWQWSSADRVAVHAVLTRHSSAAERSPALPASLTPVGLARRLLAAMGASTQVSVDNDHTVADRSAYELVLTPRSAATKIGSVHISIDGATKMPLGVQVYPRGTSSPAIDVAFTSIRFAAQAERNFVFYPPPNAHVRQASARPFEALRKHAVMTSGSGWTTVVQFRSTPAEIAKYTRGGLLKQLTPVAGSWGTGELFDSPLVSVLVTKDGRVFAGAVDPAELYAAAGSK